MTERKKNKVTFGCNIPSKPLFTYAERKLSEKDERLSNQSCASDRSPVRRRHPHVLTQPPGPSTVGVPGQHALSTAQVVGTVGHRNLHQSRVGRHEEQTLQGWGWGGRGRRASDSGYKFPISQERTRLKQLPTIKNINQPISGTLSNIPEFQKVYI